jgi:hypothetical protein
MRVLLLLLAALLFAPPQLTTRDSRLTAPFVRGPAWMQECLIYYNTFEGKPDGPDVNTEGITVGEAAETAAGGLFRRCLDTTAKPLVLKSAAFSAHRPLTLSFWWALPKDLPVDGGYSLFQFSGRGIVSAFTRGKGDWCALQRPAGVLQVYYFPGIQNVNGIYDYDLAAHLDLRAGVWHHTAVVLRQATNVQLYTDGKPVCEITLSGREFTKADALETLSLGGGVLLDEVAVLNRAVASGMIADYYRGVARLREYYAPDGARR